MAARALVCAVFALASGCTLFGLDDFAVRECKSNDTCRGVNQDHGIDITKASEVYQCASDGVGCVLGPKDWDGDGVLSKDVPGHGQEARDCDDSRADAAPGKSEVCDGVDNDCDDIVDEGEFAGGKAMPSQHLGAVLDIYEQGFFSIDFGSLSSSGEEGSLDLTYVSGVADKPRDGDGIALVTIADSITSEQGIQISDHPHPQAGGKNCPDVSNGLAGQVLCTATEVASDGRTDLVRLAAAVDRQTCAAGRVRVGEFRDSALLVSAAPPESLSACTGGYPFITPDAESCTSNGDMRGVSRLDLARLPTHDGTPAQALVAWTARHTLGHDECGKPDMTPDGSLDPFDKYGRTEVGVAALGIWHNPYDTNSVVWTTRRDRREAPELLGTTRGGGPPALGSVVLSDGSAHYLVAFAGDQGPTLRAVAELDTSHSECSHDQVPDQQLDVVRSAEPWSVAADKHVLADYMALAAGPELTSACGASQLGSRVGLAWLEGCHEASASVWFATVDFAPGTGFCNPSEPMRLGTFAHQATQSPIALGYVPRGVRPGEHAGGWFVSWVDAQGRAFVRRVSERDGKVVDAQPRMLSVPAVSALGMRMTTGEQLDLLLMHGVDSYDLTPLRLSGACSK